MNVTYYVQRASAGLIISEATPISAMAHGYPALPGIYTDAQVAGWKKVTDGVHAEGGKIVIQLWHVGRISHPSLLPNGAQPVAPSAIKPNGKAFTYQGLVDYVEPRALAVSELPSIVADYVHATKCALAAGFDGVEIHAANGYLLDQFLRDGTNKREDEYGGSIENRSRLLLEVTKAVVEVAGSDKVGIRISHCQSAYMANLSYDKARGNAAIVSGHADAIAYGVPFIANPDLVKRFSINAALNEADSSTFYGGTEHGYTDYPFLGA
jgi:N-ethylmaleimide reductase